MLYRKIPKNGDDLSILGFGCMRLPQKKGTPGDGKIDEERAKNQILYAIDNGVNYFDTAMPYHLGTSESFLGKIFTNGYRDKVKLATKLPPFHVSKPEDMEHILRAQLKKLNTDYIDYYLLHGLERKSWEKLKSFGVLDFLENEKKNQRILNTGFSFHGDRETFKEIIDAYDWEICQIQYNYLDEQNQAGRRGLKYAASKDVGVIIMEPLRGGNIARKAPSEVKDIWEQADKKRTPAEWALRWIWNHPEVSVVLSGMNEEEHIKENIRIANEAPPESLSEIELQLIETEHRQKRISWMFFATMAGAASILFGFMAVQFFSSVQGPIQLFIGGLTLIAGFLNLTSAIQVALIPFLNVILVSVPTYWWFILVVAACLLTFVLALSTRRILSPRRVSR